MTYNISYFDLKPRCLPQEVTSQHANLGSAPPYRIPIRSKTYIGMSRTHTGMLYWLLEDGTSVPNVAADTCHRGHILDDTCMVQI